MMKMMRRPSSALFVYLLGTALLGTGVGATNTIHKDVVAAGVDESIPEHHWIQFDRETGRQLTGYNHNSHVPSHGKFQHTHHTGECPHDTDNKYDPQCLQAAIPPFPICQHKTVDEWVQHAINAQDRCCPKSPQDKLEECKCPQKRSQHFLNKIDSHCTGVEICIQQQTKLNHQYQTMNSKNKLLRKTGRQ